jgi:hypothetical protein
MDDGQFFPVVVGVDNSRSTRVSGVDVVVVVVVVVGNEKSNIKPINRLINQSHTTNRSTVTDPMQTLT